MTAMNGITDELLTKKVRRKWKARCGAFILAVIAAWNGAFPSVVCADIITNNIPDPGIGNGAVNLGTQVDAASKLREYTWVTNTYTGSSLPGTGHEFIYSTATSYFLTNSTIQVENNAVLTLKGTSSGSTQYRKFELNGYTIRNDGVLQVGYGYDGRVEALIGNTTAPASYSLNNSGTVANPARIIIGDSSKLDLYTNVNNINGIIEANANSILTFGAGTTIIGGSVHGAGSAIININTNRFGSNDVSTYGTELNLAFDGSGKVVFNANTEVYGSITGSGVRLDTGINNVVLNGSIVDALTFEKIGSGRLALNGVGNDAGGVVEKRIKEGTLAFSSIDTLGSGAIRFDGESSKSRTLQLALANGNPLVNSITIQNYIYLSNASGNIDVASDSYGTTQNPSTKAYEVTNPSSLTLSEEGQIIGTFQLTKTGKGLLNIEGSNATFTGDFAIKDGTVMIESLASLGVNNNTRSVIIDSTTGDSSLVFGNSIGNGSFNRKILLQGSTGINYGVDSTYNHIGVYTNKNIDLTGTISGQSGFIKEGEGTLVLSGANNYVGETVIDNGTIVISSSSALGNSTELTFGWNQVDSSPVLQTLAAASGTTITLTKSLKVNSQNAAIDTRDFNANTKNLTIVTGDIGSDKNPGTELSLSGNLHKIGNGTLRFDGTVLNTFTGDLYIGEGTLSVGKSGSLSSYLHFGSDGRDAVGAYYVVNPLDVTRTLNIYETMVSAATIYLDVRSGNIIDIDAQKNLTLTGQIRDGVDTTGTPVSGGFTKTGAGTLTLRPTSGNVYTGATVFAQGEVIADASNVIASSESLTMGNGTRFSSTGYDQTITNLTSSYSNAVVDIGSRTLTLKAKDKSSAFSGNIVGDGTVITKLDSPTLTQSAGFVGFTGKLQLESGTLKLESDATISGISGNNSNTFLDVYNKTLTVDIATDQQYKGSIISSATPNGSGRFIKEGVGTLTTNFLDANGSNKSFGGSIEVRQGNLVVESGDFNMLSTNEAELVFYVNDIGAKPAVIDVKNGKAVFGNQLSTYGVMGSGYAGTTLRVDVRDGSGWNLAQGQHTVGEIHAAAGSVYSDYTPDQLQRNLGKGDSVLAPVEVNSLFYSVGKLVDETSQYSNLRVIIDVKGIGGVGNSRNQQQVGANLDAIRVGQTTTGIADIIKGIWETGSNVTTEYDARNKRAAINGVLTALSGDTIANSMYLGLNNHNYRGAFERLNLDAQMYFTPPDAGYYQGQEYRGQVLSNINRIWFNPYTVSTDVRSDDNARSFGTSRQGFLLGYDRRIAQNASAGLLFGYSNPYMYQDEDRVRASDFTFGAYAGAMIGYYFELKGYVGYGHQQYESTRVVTHSAWADPRQIADGRFNGDTFAVSLELARPLFFGFCIVRPTIGIDSQHVFRGAYSETGDAIALSVNQADFHQTLGRIGVSAETSTFSRFRLHGQMFFSFQLGGEDYATTKGQYIGIGSVSSQTARSVAIGSSSFDAGIGFDYYLDRSGSFALFGNYNGSSSNRMILNDVEIGIKKVF